MVQFGNADRRQRNNSLPFEIRKVQDSTRILFVSIPKRFAQLLHIDKGDLVKIQLDSDPELGNRLIIQQLYFKDGEAI
jgi:antitoxin component of MazEF toxin-antitoxin module